MLRNVLVDTEQPRTLSAKGVWQWKLSIESDYCMYLGNFKVELNMLAYSSNLRVIRGACGPRTKNLCFISVKVRICYQIR